MINYLHIIFDFDFFNIYFLHSKINSDFIFSNTLIFENFDFKYMKVCKIFFDILYYIFM